MRPIVLLATGVLLAGCGSSSAPSGGNGTSPIYQFTAANTLQFVHEFGTNTYVSESEQGDTIAGLTPDSSGNLLLAGYTAGNLPDYTVPVGILKGTLYKLDANGNQLWAKELTTGDGDTLDGVVTTPSGIFVVGDTMGAYTGMSNPAGVYEAFVAEYDNSGSELWLKQYVSSQGVYPETLCIDSGGNLIFAGEMDDSAGGQDLFIQKVDSSGNMLWEKTYGNGAKDLMESMSVDANGDIYASGSTDGTFPGGTNGYAQPFIFKLDGATGSTVWLQQFTGNATFAAMYPSAIQAVPGGKLDVLGQIGAMTGTLRIEVMQIDAATGALAWDFSFGTNLVNLPGQSLAVDASGNIYVGGMTYGALIQGATPPTQDIFLAKISPEGKGIWAQQFGTGKDGPVVEFSGATPIYLSLGGQSIFMGGMTTGQFQGFSNPNQDLELFLAKFGQ